MGAEDDLRRERGQAPMLAKLLAKAATKGLVSIHDLRTGDSPEAVAARAAFIETLRARGWHDSSIRLHVLDPKWVPILPRKARGKVSRSGEYRVAIPPRAADKPAPVRPAPRPYQSAPAAIVAPPGTGDGVPYVRTMGDPRSYDMREKLVTLPYFEQRPATWSPPQPGAPLDLEWIESDENEKTTEGAATPTREPASTGPASSLAGGGSAEPAILAPVPPIVPEVAFFPVDHPVASSLVPDSARWEEASRVNLVTLPEPAIELGPPRQWPPAYGALKPGETCAYIDASAPASIDPESVAIYAEAVEESRERARQAERKRSGPDAQMPKWLRDSLPPTPNCAGPGQGIEGAACKSLGLFRDSLDRPVCGPCLKGFSPTREPAPSIDRAIRANQEARRQASDEAQAWAKKWRSQRGAPELMGVFEEIESLGAYAPGGKRAAAE